MLKRLQPMALLEGFVRMWRWAKSRFTVNELSAVAVTVSGVSQGEGMDKAPAAALAVNSEPLA